MKIGVIGAGYVGLTAAASFARAGHNVVVADNNQDVIQTLNSGSVQFYEDGLECLIASGRSAGNIEFILDINTAVRDADFVFIAVGTPESADGSTDLTALKRVAGAMRGDLETKTIVVLKSTVPPGTTKRLSLALRKAVVFAPEFLREGHALSDFAEPDRIVLGYDGADAYIPDQVIQLYRSVVPNTTPFFCMSAASAEMVKYAANAMLATRISFMNELGNICNHVGADVRQVRLGIGSDTRIGFGSLVPGVGYGGSCFPKDIRSLIHTGRSVGAPCSLLQTVEDVNERQKASMLQTATRVCRIDQNSIVAVWGLAFKADTDDVRESPSLQMIEEITGKLHAQVQAHDPKATDSFWKQYTPKSIVSKSVFDTLSQPNCVTTYDDKYEALVRADVLLIVVPWKEYENIDVGLMAHNMRGNCVIDGRTEIGGGRDKTLAQVFRYVPLFFQ